MRRANTVRSKKPRHTAHEKRQLSPAQHTGLAFFLRTAQFYRFKLKNAAAIQNAFHSDCLVNAGAFAQATLHAIGKAELQSHHGGLALALGFAEYLAQRTRAAKRCAHAAVIACFRIKPSPNPIGAFPPEYRARVRPVRTATLAILRDASPIREACRRFRPRAALPARWRALF